MNEFLEVFFAIFKAFIIGMIGMGIVTAILFPILNVIKQEKRK